MILQGPLIASKSWLMTQEELSDVRIAIVSYSLKHRQQLQKVMEYAGLRVVINEHISNVLLEKLDSLKVDIIMLDLDVSSDQQQNFITALLDKTSTPIIFNDMTVLDFHKPSEMDKWYGKLFRKIASSTDKVIDQDKLDLVSDYSSLIKFLSTEHADNKHKYLAKNIWILGASLGGPDAVKTFLAEIPKDLPVAFILAQHLGENFDTRLAEQLNKVTPFKVMNPHTGHVLRHGEVLVVPIDRRLNINPIGAVELLPLTTESAYSPSIDLVMQDFSERYKHKVNAIIFSGMCNDGVAGAKQVSTQGGDVWVQSLDSCVVGSMPENVDKAIDISFSGAPQALAQELVKRYQ